MSSTLSDKHQSFVDEYLIDLNASRAYQAVYSCSGRSARTHGNRLLSDSKIMAVLAHHQSERSIRCQITPDDILIYWVSVMNERKSQSLQASEYIAKSLGMFRDSHSTEGRPVFVGLSITMKDGTVKNY